LDYISGCDDKHSVENETLLKSLIEQKYSLLLAENNDHRFNNLQNQLKVIHLNVEVHRARSYSEITRRLGQYHFDILLLSQDLKDETGIEILRKLANQGLSLPVLFIIPLEDKTPPSEILSAGALEILREPEINPQLLDHLLFSCKERWVREQNRILELHKSQVLGLATQEGVALTDGHIIHEINEAFATLLGYQPHEIPGLSINRFFDIPPESKGDWLKVAEYTPILARKKNRAPLPLLYRQTPVTYMGKNAYLLTLRVSRRSDKPSEQKKANYYKALVDSTQDFFCVFSPKGHFKYITPALHSVLGYSLKEARGSVIWDWLMPNESTKILKHFSDGSWLAGQSRMIEVCIRHKQGDFKYLECIVRNRITDPVIRGIVVNCRDITLRRQAEEDLIQSRSRFEMISRISNDGIWDLDLRNGLLWVSPRLLEILKLDPAQGLTKWEHIETLVHLLDRDLFKQSYERHLTENRPLILDVRLVKGDGKYGYFTFRAESIRDESNKAIYIAGSITDITARKTAENLVRYESLYDQLTNLPKRELLYDRILMCIQRAQKNDSFQFSVLLIDLDRFTNIINSFGHDHADKLLLEFSLRIKRCIGKGSTLSRLSGDEFGLLLEDCSVNRALRISQLIEKSLAKSFKVMHRDVFLSVSIGITLNGPIYEGADDMMRDAGVAMNRAKKKGKGTAEVFNTVMHFGAVRRLQIEMDMRRALDRDEFILHYQPIATLDSGKIGSLECLIRWNHPQKGLVMPLDFIPVAEETGLILTIDEWVLQKALEQFNLWKRQGLHVPKMAINFSARQFRKKELTSLVETALKNSRVKPEFLEIEITETTLMENEDNTLEALKILTDLGVHLSIDDFGTGYSSLGYLCRFPSQTLKIDASFINGLGRGKQEAAIVAAIIALAKNLGLHLIAEGVETPEQLNFLREKKCDDVQGFMIARPMDHQAFASFLNNKPEGIIIPQVLKGL